MRNFFKFYEAFELYKQWLKRHPDDVSDRTQFAESYFTTGRFDDSSKLITELLSKHDLEPSLRIALRAINIGNLVAINGPKLAQQLEIKALITEVANQPDNFDFVWSFKGVKHFINENEKLTARRTWLLTLFNSMEEKN